MALVCRSTDISDKSSLTKTILERLKKRNKLVENLAPLIEQNIRFSEEITSLNSKLQLSAELSRRRDSVEGDEKTDDRVRALQHELLEFHRKRDTDIQHIHTCEQELKQREKLNYCLQVENAELKRINSEIDSTKAVLIEELTSLKTNYLSLQNKHHILQEQLNAQSRNWSTGDHDNETKAPTIFPNVRVQVPSRVINTYEGHESEVNAVIWSPSGRVFATGGKDSKINLWEYRVAASENKGELSGGGRAIMSLDIDHREESILAACGDACHIWSLQDQRLRHTLKGHNDKVLAAKYLDIPSWIVSGSHDKTLKIWDLNKGTCIRTMYAESKCNDVVISGVNVISGHFDKKIRFWDTRTGEKANMIPLSGSVTSLAVSSANNLLLGCSRDNTIMIADLRMNRVMGALQSDSFIVGYDWSRAAFSPDGQYIMAGSQNGSVHIWHTSSFNNVQMLKGHTSSVIASAWHPVGKLALTSDKQGKTIAWSP